MVELGDSSNEVVTGDLLNGLALEASSIGFSLPIGLEDLFENLLTRSLPWGLGDLLEEPL